MTRREALEREIEEYERALPVARQDVEQAHERLGFARGARQRGAAAAVQVNENQLRTLDNALRGAEGVLQGYEEALEQAKIELGALIANAPKAAELASAIRERRSSHNHFVDRLQGWAAQGTELWQETAANVAEMTKDDREYQRLTGEPSLLLDIEPPDQAITLDEAVFFRTAPQTVRQGAAAIQAQATLRNRLSILFDQSAIPGRAEQIRAISQALDLGERILSALAAGTDLALDSGPAGTPDFVAGPSGSLVAPGSGQASSIEQGVGFTPSSH